MADLPDDEPAETAAPVTSAPRVKRPDPHSPATKAAAKKAAAAEAAAKANAPSRPVAKKVDPAKTAARSGNPRKKAEARSESARYTAPVPNSYKVSPWYVPAMMFGFLGLGMIIIFLNYMGWPFGDPSNWRLLIGLASILAGILVATRYQ